jgi:hypothetical protein
MAELNDFHRLVLQIVCDLYARPGDWAADENISKYSLYRLDEVFKRLLYFQRRGIRCHFESALESSKSRLTDEEFGALLDLGHRMWMERYRISPTVVVEKIADFLTEIRDMAPTVLGIALPGPTDHINVVLQRLADDNRWQVYDFRTSSEGQVLGEAANIVAGGVVLIASDPTLKPPPLRFLANAVADRQATVRLGHERIDISPDTIMVFIFGAAIPFYMIEANDSIMYSVEVDEFEPKS